MNSVEFRNNFEKFLDDKVRYEKFLALINRGKDKRPLFWQERAIEQFCEKFSLEVPSFNELEEVFSVCEVHGNQLEEGKVKVFTGHIDCTQAYDKACLETFPNSHLSEVNGPKEMYGKYYEILFCPACREAEYKWREQNA